MSTDRPGTHQDFSRLMIIAERTADPACCRLVLAGELDATSSGKLHAAVLDVLHRRAPCRIELNLRGVPYLDSAGIHALLVCHADARHVHCGLTLTDPHPWAYRLLQITGLLDHFGVTRRPSNLRRRWPSGARQAAEAADAAGRPSAGRPK